MAAMLVACLSPMSEEREREREWLRTKRAEAVREERMRMGRGLFR